MSSYGSSLFGLGPYGGVSVATVFPAAQILVAFNNNATDDPAAISSVASPPGTLGGANVWTDISRYCLGFTRGGGRSHELASFEAGTCEAQIDGRTAGTMFNPWNTSSPYAGLLTIRKPFQVRAVWSGTTYKRFTGQVDSWVTQWPDASSTRQVVHSADAFRMWNTANLTTNGYPAQVLADGAVAYWRLGELAGSGASFDSGPGGYTSSLVTGPVTFGGAGAFPANLGTSVAIGSGIPRAEILWPASGLANGLTAVTVEFWFNHTSASDVLVVAASPPNLADCASVDFGNSSAGKWNGMLNSTTTPAGSALSYADGIWHHLMFTYNGAAAFLYIDGVSVSGGVINGNLTGAGGAVYTFGVSSFSLQEFAVYPTALTAAQAANHAQLGAFPQEATGARIGRTLTALGWSAGARAIDTTGTTVQAQTSTLTQTSGLSHMQSVEATESGGFFMSGDGKATFITRQSLFTNSLYTTSQATLGDNTGAGDIPYQPGPTLARDDIDLYNEALATRTGGAQVSATDSASIAFNGRSTWRPAAALIGVSDSEVLGLCQYAVGKYATPTDRFGSVTVDLAAVANSFPAVIPTLLSLGLLQRITVRRTLVPGGGTTFSQVAQIEHISETVGPNSWTITFGLAVADPNPYWILGTSALGTNTRLAF